MPGEIEVKSVLNKTKRRDPWFLDDYTFNPYSSCSFNCVFCYIRGSKYGENLEKSLSVKTNAIELLDKQLGNRAKKGQYGIIVLSSATDPYLHFEKEYMQTRQALEVILKHRFPIHVITRSDLITRDLDLIRKISEQAVLPEELKGKVSGAIVSFSFSTLDDQVNKLFEPGATQPSQRLEALKKTRSALSSKVGVAMMPLLPYITDVGENLTYMYHTFKEAKVDYILPASLTLFGEGPSASKTLTLKIVGQHYPHLMGKYLKFFSSGFQVPYYYQTALEKKAIELSEIFGVPRSIL